MTEQIVAEGKGLVKKYGDKAVVNAINFQIKKGECYGLLGPNGAGKTSTMKMMYCLSPVTAGNLHVLGLDVTKSAYQIKKRIGVVPQEDGLDPDFTVLENLLIYASYFNLPKAEAEKRAKELLRFMKIDEKSSSSVEQLSGGMKRRLAIARGMINNPEMLFLDEPTTGLDPQARHLIWDNLRELKKRGLSMVLTTHYMEEAEQICDRLAIMDHGKFLCEGRPTDLIVQYIGHEVVDFICQDADKKYVIEKIKDKYDYQVIRNRFHLFIKKGQDGRQALTVVPSDDVTVRKATLEDVFLKVAGHELRD
ncbi:MAG: ATP-binding cassette domain-containing protein [Oligoflexia bacterium]|nr:ATP-binding cassette domain-containing protein [Oligoflexia bacterium]